MRTKLTEESIQEGLQSLPDWKYAEGEIHKTYYFDMYQSALVFAVAVGNIAIKMDHHPDLVVSYGKVKVSLSSHDAGGVTFMDLDFAKKVEVL